MAVTIHGTKGDNTDLQTTESSVDLNGKELILDTLMPTQAYRLILMTK